MENNLTPSLTEEQLKQNIDAMKGKLPDPEIQSYVNNYSKNPNGGYTLATQLKSQQENPSFLHEASGDVSSALQGAGQALVDSSTGKINPLSGILQGTGALAGGINSLVNTTAKHLPIVGPAVKGVEGLIGKGVGALAQTGPGQAVMGKVQNFNQTHPELSGNIGAGVNILGTVGLVTGAGAAKEAVAGALGKDALAPILEDVSAQIGTKAAAKSAAKQGLVKTFLKGEIKPVADKTTQEIAQTVAESVPEFSKLKTFTDKLNAVKDAVYERAANLKQQVIDTGSDRAYTYKELGSNLRNIERPLLVASDSALNNAYDRVIAKAMDIAKQSGGKVSDLFEARKTFDQFISEQFPNLYSSETLTPMRSAVKNIRNGINQFIEDRLPEGSGFRDELLKQSKLFDAAENIAPKAVKEIGTTRLGRFAGRHPLIGGAINQVKKYAIPAIIGEETLRRFNK